MRIPIARTFIISTSLVIYFKKRKLYVDDKSYQIRYLPKKSITVYRKDIVNSFAIIGSCSFVFSFSERVFEFAKKQYDRYDIDFHFKIEEKINSDSEALPKASEYIKTSEAVNKLEPSSKFQLPVRDIFYTALLLGIAWYLGQRISISADQPLNDVSESSKVTATAMFEQKTEFNWWDRLTMDDKLIKDFTSEENPNTMIRSVEKDLNNTGIEPIKSSEPRRIVLILFNFLQQNKNIKGIRKISIPTWVISPAFWAAQQAYRYFNK